VISWKLLALAGLGGTAGALLRYGAGRLGSRLGKPAHYATLAVNWAGSLAIGALVSLNVKAGHEALYVFIGTGVLGGLTTYSTLNVQKAAMSRERKFRLLAAYATLTYLGGWAALAAGMGLGRLFGG
jgi:CrcB protein